MSTQNREAAADPRPVGTMLRRALRGLGRSARLELRRQVARAPRIPGQGATAAFIVGCQRSGTTMLGRALAQNPWVDYYPESDQRAFHHVRIRDRDTIERLLRRTRAQVAVFKPLCDTQHLLRLLIEHNDSRGVWIYRDPAGAAASAVRAWGDHFLHAMRTLVFDPDEASWFGEGPSLRQQNTVARLLPHASTPLAGAALFWLARNQLFFDLRLDRDPRVLLVRYEWLLADPERWLRRICDSLGLGWDARVLCEIDRSRGDRRATLDLPLELGQACSELLARLDSRCGGP